jgi:hypothetical protein
VSPFVASRAETCASRRSPTAALVTIEAGAVGNRLEKQQGSRKAPFLNVRRLKLAYTIKVGGPEATAPTGSVGGDGRIRTGDLLRAKQALSQLSYAPTCL